MKFSIQVTSLGTSLLKALDVRLGDFESCFIRDVEQMWGPIDVTVPNVCSLASHRITCLDPLDALFTCRIIHSIPWLMSAIHVFCKDTLCVVGHLVGADQLPIPSQVNDTQKCVTLDPMTFERAILIKNNDGDWGIVSAHWTGFKCGKSSYPGNIKARLYKIANQSWTNIFWKSQYEFTVDETKINLIEGTIWTLSNKNIIAEYIAVAFSVSLLHVLCQPRPMDGKPGQEEKTIRFLNMIKMFSAVQMSIVTPSNHHIRITPGQPYHPFYMGGPINLSLKDDSCYDMENDKDFIKNGCSYGFEEVKGHKIDPGVEHESFPGGGHGGGSCGEQIVGSGGGHGGDFGGGHGDDLGVAHVGDFGGSWGGGGGCGGGGGGGGCGAARCGACGGGGCGGGHCGAGCFDF